MKKVLSLLVLSCISLGAAISLSSCGGATPLPAGPDSTGSASTSVDSTSKVEVSSISLDTANVKKAYYVGEAFSTEGLKVTVTKSDKSSTVITTGFTVSGPNTADMAAAGCYSVLVSYEGAYSSYAITVSSNTVASVGVDTSAAKTSYKVGESLSLEGVIIYETYSDGSVSKVSDVSGYATEVKDAKGTVVTDLAKEGKYTVSLKKGEIGVSYAITVLPYAGNVKEAVDSAVANYASVVKAELVSSTYRDGPEVHSKEVSEFGDNYLHLVSSYYSSYSKSWSVSSNQHISIINDKIVCIDESDGSYSKGMVNGDAAPAKLMQGSQVSMFYYNETYYGAEDMLSRLYADGVANTYSDFEEIYYTSMGVNYYNFSYSKVYDPYLFSVDVTFTLSEAHCLDSLSVTTKMYSDFSVVEPEDPDSDENATINVTEGTLMSPSKIDKFDFTFTSGERTAKNELIDKYTVESYDLTLNGSAIADTVNMKVSDMDNDINNLIQLKIENIAPATAAENLCDSFEFSVDDGEYSTWYYEDDMALTYSDGNITINGYKPGTHTIKIKSIKLTKEFTVNIGYLAPTSLTNQVFVPNDNPRLASLITLGADEVQTAYVGNDVYVRAIPQSCGDPDVSAKVGDVALTKVTMPYGSDEIEVFKYTPTVAGPVDIVFTSNNVEATDVTSTLHLNVKEAPNFAEILSGNYSFDNESGYPSIVKFTPVSEGALSGTVSVKVRDTLKNTYEETLTYAFDAETKAITLTSTEEDATKQGNVSLVFDSFYNLRISYSYNNSNCVGSEIKLSEYDIANEIDPTVYGEYNCGSDKLVVNNKGVSLNGTALVVASVTADGKSFVVGEATYTYDSENSTYTCGDNVYEKSLVSVDENGINMGTLEDPWYFDMTSVSGNTVYNSFGESYTFDVENGTVTDSYDNVFTLVSA